MTVDATQRPDTADGDLGLGGGWHAGLAYGALGLPLAFVALPLYVLLPSHYSQTLGVPLASLGLLLLLARMADALIDPLIGRLVDRLLLGARQHLLLASLGAAALLALSFQALMFPPVQGTGPLLAWCGMTLAGCYLGFSGLTVLHQAWGAQLGGQPVERARVVAWREGLALLGVVLASLLPTTVGLQATSALLAVLLMLALAGLFNGPRAQAVPRSQADQRLWQPLHDKSFRRLLVIYLLNGVASALPATLVLFFIRDRLQAPAWEAAFLGAYFGCAALSLPLWVRAVSRWGLARSWLLGMTLSWLSFIGAWGLGAGDAPVFLAICMASGAALGADLSAPPALLAGLLRRPEARHAGEGSYFGWWNVATKFNLALAAGVALPLLQGLGYQPGGRDAAGLQALSAVYALLPCLLKMMAAAALGWLWIRKEPE